MGSSTPRRLGHEGWAEWVQCTTQPLLLWGHEGYRVTHGGALGVGNLGKTLATLLWVSLLGQGLGRRGTALCSGSAASAVGWQNLISKINSVASSYEKPSTSRTHFITCSAVFSLMFYLVKRDYVKSLLSYSVRFLNWSEAAYMDVYLFSAGGDI